MSRNQVIQILEKIVKKRPYRKFARTINEQRSANLHGDDTSYTALGVIERMNCDRSIDFHGLLREFVHPIVQDLPFPRTVSTSDICDVFSEHLAGFELHPENSSADQLVLKRCAYFLLARAEDAEILELWKAAHLINAIPEDLERRRISRTCLAIPASFWQSWESGTQKGVIPRYAFGLPSVPLGEIDSRSKDEWSELDRAFLDGTAWQNPIWSVAHGPALYLLPAGFDEPEREQDSYYMCDIFLAGRFSATALREAVEQLAPVVEAVTSAVAASATLRERHQLPGTCHEDVFAPHAGESPEMEDSIASLAYFFSEDAGNMIQAGVEVLLATGFGEDTLDHRIYNSFRLMALADKVPGGDDGLALALSFAAIESLISDESATKDVANLGSVLLQPNPEKRKGAQQQIRRLYDYRNQIMHGRKIAGSRTRRLMAKRLAAGILRAVLSYRRHLSRLGKKCCREDLLVELKVSHLARQELVGVEDLSDLLPAGLPRRPS